MCTRHKSDKWQVTRKHSFAIFLSLDRAGLFTPPMSFASAASNNESTISRSSSSVSLASALSGGSSLRGTHYDSDEFNRGQLHGHEEVLAKQVSSRAHDTTPSSPLPESLMGSRASSPANSPANSPARRRRVDEQVLAGAVAQVSHLIERARINDHAASPSPSSLVSSSASDSPSLEPSLASGRAVVRTADALDQYLLQLRQAAATRNDALPMLDLLHEATAADTDDKDVDTTGWSFAKPALHWSVIGELFDSAYDTFGVSKRGAADDQSSSVKARISAFLLAGSKMPAHLPATDTSLGINLPSVVADDNNNMLLLRTFASHLYSILHPAVAMRFDFSAEVVTPHMSAITGASAVSGCEQGRVHNGLSYLVNVPLYVLSNVEPLRNDRTRFTGLGVFDRQHPYDWMRYVPSHRGEDVNDKRLYLDSVLALFSSNPLYTPIAKLAEAALSPSATSAPSPSRPSSSRAPTRDTPSLLVWRQRVDVSLAVLREMIKLKHTRTAASPQAHDIIHNCLVETEQAAELETDAAAFAKKLVTSTQVRGFGLRQHEITAEPLDETATAFFANVRSEVASYYYDSNTFLLVLTEMITLLPAYLAARDMEASHEQNMQQLQAFIAVCSRAYVEKESTIYHRLKLHVRTLRNLEKIQALLCAKVESLQARSDKALHNAAMQKIVQLVQTLTINRLVSVAVRTLPPVALVGFLFAQRQYLQAFMPAMLKRALNEMLDTERTPVFMLRPDQIQNCCASHEAAALFALLRE